MRCFIALTPDPDTALAIDAWRRSRWSSLARPVPVQNLHLTLGFLGDVRADRVSRLEQELNALDEPTIDVPLRSIGYFPGNGIVWIGPPEGDRESRAAVERLAEQTRRIVRRVGIRIEAGRFRPHVTIARGQREPPPEPLTPPDFRLLADDVELYESILDRAGARYRVIASWPLRA